MSETTVQELFRRALTANDADAMREGVERLFGLVGREGVSAEAEYALRHDDYVMEMPQSGERIRGRDAMRAMQESFPTPPTITLRRVVGSGQVWVLEGVNDYEGDRWHAVVILELDPDGLIRRDTRYYSQELEAPDWRASLVDRM